MSKYAGTYRRKAKNVVAKSKGNNMNGMRGNGLKRRKRMTQNNVRVL
jgi:hypothetical protein